MVRFRSAERLWSGDGFLAGDRPAERGEPVRVDASTTPRALVFRTVWGANRYTLPGMILMIGHFVGEAMVPFVMGRAIDLAIVPQDRSALIFWLAILAADFLLLSVTWRFGERMVAYAVQVIEHQFRMRVTDRMLEPVAVDGPSRLPGTALSIATSDVSRLSRAVLLAVLPVGEMFAVLVAGVVLLWISWPLGLTVLIGAPVMFWILDRAGAPLRRRTERQQENIGQAAGTAADLVSGLRVLKGIGAENEAGRRYRGASGRARDSAIAAMRTEGVYVAVLQTVSSLFVVVIGVAAGASAVSGALTVGELITVVGLTQFVMGPLNAIGTNVGIVWNAAVASATRILAVLQARPVVETGDERPRTGDLAITGLEPAVPDVRIASRGLTVIAADRTTGSMLTGLLSRDTPPGDTLVRVGGVDLFALDQRVVRAAVRVVPHSPHLFEGTVLENIAAASDSDSPHSDERCTRAVFAAACDDVAEALVNGLDTPVGEAGRMLSGGQRQRVGLARALAADSSFLVLTDPTTAVDSVTEATVAERVRRARAGAATVVLSRSPAWLAVADTVIRIESDRHGAVAGRPATGDGAPG
ncbi:ABC transporter transmembrane domain-containing protein [Gordonia zhaorongruii]|uniref:ABC transporter transmembrane domain-containing protein n=1 Tax=Gordonia zhaorongruii TaxID=2597659 RepID=UPI0010528608|nr:ABC transporter ATP-binding protein [Gordonia zhaorongruii]